MIAQSLAIIAQGMGGALAPERRRA